MATSHATNPFTIMESVVTDSTENRKPQEECMEDDDENDTTCCTTTTCPLFMDGLPQNFQQNTQLAAIASLLEDHIQEEKEAAADKKEPSAVYRCVLNRDRKISRQRNKPAVVKKAASTAAKSSSYRKNLRSKPKTNSSAISSSKREYSTDPTISSGVKSHNTASIGDTTLFLSMWKI
jgi:hypothetical protein